MTAPRVLLIDDEPQVLDGYRRNLRRHFDITTAAGPHEGLDAAASGDPFEAVVSDLQMPGMDGIEVLRKIRELSPDTARIMLTGQADLDASIAAVNDGHVFRFLTKPCSPETLARALEDGAEQFRLRRAEKELLEDTLRGTVELLVEVLGLANPTRHDQAERLRVLVSAMSATVGMEEDWELELATMLSQLGTITLPDEVLHKIADGLELTSDEQRMVEHHPEAAYNLLVRIPRLENVARMIRLQLHSAADFPDSVDDDPVLMGALMIGVASAYDTLISRGRSQNEAIEAIRRSRSDALSGDLVEALAAEDGPTFSWESTKLGPDDVHSGMVIDADLKASSGALLLPKGRRMTPALLERLRAYARGIGIEGESVAVLVPKADR